MTDRMNELEAIASARAQGAAAGTAAKQRDWARTQSCSEYFRRWLAVQHGDLGMLQAEYDSAYRAKARSISLPF